MTPPTNSYPKTIHGELAQVRVLPEFLVRQSRPIVIGRRVKKN